MRLAGQCYKRRQRGQIWWVNVDLALDWHLKEAKKIVHGCASGKLTPGYPILLW